MSQKQIIQSLGNGNEAKAVKKLMKFLGKRYDHVRPIPTTMKELVQKIMKWQGEEISLINPEQVVKEFKENEQKREYDPNMRHKELYRVSLADSKTQKYLYCGSGPVFEDQYGNKMIIEPRAAYP